MSHVAHIEKACCDLESLVETMNCGLMARDEDGVIVYVNECLAKWLGCTAEEILGRRADLFVPAELRDMVESERKALNAGDVRARLAILQRKDQTTFPVISIPQRHFDAQGRLSGTFTVLVDVGALQTAKPLGYGGADAARQALQSIALQLQTISLTAELPQTVAPAYDHPALSELSPREKEILAHLVAGSRVPAIAKRLHISPHTVRNHLKSIFRKIGVRSQSALIERVRALSR